VLLLSCQPALPLPQAYLTPPFFNFTATNGVCIRVIAVDGNRQGWKQDQCTEAASGYLQTRVLTPAEFDQVTAAFDPLPAESDPACTNNFLPGSTITYLRRGTAGAGATDITWTACVTGTELAPPYKLPVDLLEQLVDTP
jgi:hypothetical protein